MTQHINLLRRQRLVPASLMWGGLGVLVFALAQASYGAWLVMDNAQTQARIRAQEAELVQLRAQVVQAGLRSASATQLQDDISRLTPLARAYETLLQQVASGRLGLESGYLEQFTILARTVAPKVWITQVSLTDAGRKFSLQGQALDESSVLDYVDRLNQAYAAQGLALVTLDMSVQTPANGTVAAAAGASGVAAGIKTVSFRLN
jgi:Tfp pilus assembly protein PilN